MSQGFSGVGGGSHGGNGSRSGARSALAGTIFILLSLVICGDALPDPVANAGEEVQSHHTGRPLVFEGVGTPDPSLRIILYEWDFDGDGVFDWNSTLSGFASHIYIDPGEYIAKLRITQWDASGEGELLTAEDTVDVRIVSGEPVGTIASSSRAPVGKKFELRSNCYDPDGGQLTYQWTIDGTPVSDQPSFVHKFTTEKDYNITLVVTDDEGESVRREVILSVEKMDDVSGIPLGWAVGVIVVMFLMLVIAVVAYSSIRKAATDKGAPHLESLEKERPILPEASLKDQQGAPEKRPKLRVVQPERRKAAKAKTAKQPVRAKPRCPECGTELFEDGSCHFCEANESIDEVERRMTELVSEGYILPEVADRLEGAKAALHVKNFGEISTSLQEADAFMQEAMKDHEECIRLMGLVEELVDEARDHDLDVDKAANLLKLSKSFLKSGKYPKAMHYAERSRDFLIEILEPFDLDRYFCEHCKGEVDVEDVMCPHCESEIQSGLLKRARHELQSLRQHLEGLGRKHPRREDIASHLDRADYHVGSGSLEACEHLDQARKILDSPEEEEPTEKEGGEAEGEPEDAEAPAAWDEIEPSGEGEEAEGEPEDAEAPSEWGEMEPPGEGEEAVEPSGEGVEEEAPQPPEEEVEEEEPQPETDEDVPQTKDAEEEEPALQKEEDSSREEEDEGEETPPPQTEGEIPRDEEEWGEEPHP